MKKSKNLSIHAVIPAAGRPTNRILSNTTLPDTMIPINGQPVIGYIIEDLLERGVYQVTLVLSSADTVTEKYIARKFKNFGEVKIVYNDQQNKGIGHSIFLATQGYEQKDAILIYLGDTIYKGILNFEKNFLVVSDQYDEPDKWCFVEKEGNDIKFINKPKEYNGNGKILSGIYFFRDSKKYVEEIKELEYKKETFEIKDILEIYAKKYTFEFVNAQKWYDCGNIENYYRAKIDFLKLRRFNKIEYNDLYGYITKSGKNKEKLTQEINWYINTPKELQIFAPRLIDYQIDKNVSYSTEYYGYPTLADLFVFNSFDIRLWKIIISQLLKITNLFKKYPAKIPYGMYEEMYVQKTKNRLDLLIKESDWKSLFNEKSIFINGKEYKNVNFYLSKLPKNIKRLYNTNEMAFIHGDLCLSNILFDPSSRIFKLIDPSGKFGKEGIYGDLKYDIAKLRHSFSGKYDFIKSNMFELTVNKKNDFTFNIFSEKIHSDISDFFDNSLVENGFDLGQIKFIESQLFLSMIPLHKENKSHQLAMFCVALQLMQETIE